MIAEVEPHDGVPLVRGTVALPAGWSRDPTGREGTARICARLLRRGAWGYNAAASEARIAELGAELWTETTPVATLVHFRVLRRGLERFADLLATMLAKPALSEDEIARQKQAAIAELTGLRASDAALAGRSLRRAVFGDHPYGRSGAGTRASVAAIEREDVTGFHLRCYVRDDARVALSGDLTREIGEGVAQRIVARLPAGSPGAVALPPVRGAPGRRLVFVDKPMRAQVPIVLGGLAGHPRDSDYPALVVACTAFGGTFSSRLVQEIRVRQGLSYGVASKLEANAERELFVVEAAPPAHSAAACLARELELLRTFRAHGLTEDECAFARSYLVRSHPLGLEIAHRRAELPLRASLLGVPRDFYERFRHAIEGVTRDAAGDAARARLPEDDLVIAAVGAFSEIGEAMMRAAGPVADVELLAPDFE